MRYLLAALVGLLFGAGIEQLGSLPFEPWAWTASQLSAPWLLLPFAFGAVEDRAPRAAGLGLSATLCAVAGYVWMLGVAAGHAVHSLTASLVLHEAQTQAHWFVAGSVSGPIYGVLGQRWRRSRWWPSAVLCAGALALEPIVLLGTGRTFGPSAVYFAEMAAGIALGAWMLVPARRTSRAARDSHQTVHRQVPG